jgi:hypothetical protein
VTTFYLANQLVKQTDEARSRGGLNKEQVMLTPNLGCSKCTSWENLVLKEKTYTLFTRMDIERFFPTGSSKVTINVHGTDDEPLFQASQIGQLLGLVNIRTSIADFDDDEKGVHTMYTLGGAQSALFLTELGLYRLLGQSRQPVVRPFQKWVATKWVAKVGVT